MIPLGNNDDQFKIKTGLNRSQFEILLEELPSLIDEFRNERDASNALFIYLMKLRTAGSNSLIGCEVNWSRHKVEKAMPIVRKILYDDFALRYINYERSREDLISQTSLFSQHLFSPENQQKVVLIWDGTYIYIEKSGQHKFQKQTYNSHKKRNYVKPMMIVSTNGTIIGAIGPFKATENDATMTKKILVKDIPALKNVSPEDIIIVDRGFRDAVVPLQNQGFVVEIPGSTPANKQLTTAQANKARLITRVRYDVERLNGVVKNVFKIFASVWETYSVPHLMLDFTIACALINKFFNKSLDGENDEAVAQKMLDRAKLENKLTSFVYLKQFKTMIRRKSYALLENLESFPELSLDDCKEIAFGSYQIEQAKQYAYNHKIQNNESFRAFVFNKDQIKSLLEKITHVSEEPMLIMCVFSSRFMGSKQYKAFVLVDMKSKGQKAIIEYHCECKVGARTVGSCSHVMTILFYLGYAQFNGGVKPKAKHLDPVFDEFKDDFGNDSECDDEHEIIEDELIDCETNESE